MTRSGTNAGRAGGTRRGRSRRRGAGEGEHGGNDERWMASYMDMVTVLMCLFIVLFAMSTVDQEKYEQLKSSLASGFGIELVDDAEAVPVTRVRQATVDDLMVERAAAQREVADLLALRDRIRADLIERGVERDVQFEITDRGLTVRLVGAETFFDGNSAGLRDHARTVLAAIAPRLLEVPHQVAVEGHAEPLGDPAPYPTDWELSADRATKVLRFLVEQGGMPQQRIESAGFGSARPATTGGTAEERALNRRVEIVVLSAQPEDVRRLLPGLAG